MTADIREAMQLALEIIEQAKSYGITSAYNASAAAALRAALSEPKRCKYGDPSCPCQDGDMCHYEGPNPMTPPASEPQPVDVAEMERRKDAAYLERNQVVAGLAALAVTLGYPACRTRTAIEGWSEDWHGCVFIGLPTGQVSWHYHDSQADLFSFLPEQPAIWDGHDTPEKYRRVLALRNAAPQGYVLVPVEPSQEYWDKAWAQIRCDGHITGSASVVQIKRMFDACHTAMLSAAKGGE